MANLDTAEFANMGLVDKRTGRGSAATQLSSAANYRDITNMRTRLAAINGSYYTSAMLDTMTRNDMIYAIRQNDDIAGQ